MNRILALVILLLPGIMAVVGFKLMKDMVFLWLQFLIGLAMFILGLWFIAGFILHRDRKRNKVQSRFQNHDPKDDEETKKPDA